MSPKRIGAILVQEFYITKRSLEVIMDLFFTSLMTVIVFGFVSRFLVGVLNAYTGSYLILGMLLWEVIRVNQYSLSVGSLWNIWSRNLSNLFIAPLTMKEYIAAHMLSGLLKTLLIFGTVSAVAAAGFQFDILRLGILNLTLFFTNLTVFSWSLGLVLLGVIFLVGTRIQALAWGLVFLFQPLTAAFYPVGVLPPVVQRIAYALPPTFVFEAARQALATGAVNWTYAAIAFGENLVYFGLALAAFTLMFARARNTGQFARNEG
ncbi:MAG TPA: ABC transporter permease [bacterium]|nr:ABC transporter permease [bacterium]